MAARKTAAQKRAEQETPEQTPESEAAAKAAQEQADELQRDAEEPSGDSDTDSDATEQAQERAKAAEAAEVNTEITDANGAPNDPHATGAVATANGVLPPEPGTETRVGIDGVADPVLINKVPGASVGAFPVSAEHQPETAEQRPNDPNAHGATHLANGELPVEPGTETRVGVDGVAEPKIIRKESSPEVPGAPLEAPRAMAVQVSNVEQTHATPGALGAAVVGQGEELVDAATGEAPDPDAMFKPVVGAVYESQVRLVEKVAVGNGSYTTRMVLPRGQHVSAVTAERFMAAVRAQG